MVKPTVEMGYKVQQVERASAKNYFYMIKDGAE
jgi:hypothetical protein